MKHETHFPIPPAIIVRSLCSALNRASREPWLATAFTLPHVSAAEFWGVGSKMPLIVYLVAINFPTLSSSQEEITAGKFLKSRSARVQHIPTDERTSAGATQPIHLALERRSQYPKVLLQQCRR